MNSDLECNAESLEVRCKTCDRRWCHASTQGVAVELHQKGSCLYCQYKDRVKEDGSVDLDPYFVKYLERMAEAREDKIGKMAVNCLSCFPRGEISENCSLCKGRGWIMVDKVTTTD